MRRRLAILAVCLLLAGCGGSGSGTNPGTVSTGTTSAGPSPTAALEQAARSAIEQNTKLSDYVLAHNSVPAWASQSTSGPALAALRSAAAHREAGKVRVQLLTGNVAVRSVQLDPSYQSATASIVERSRVRVYQHGHAIGGVRNLNEPATVELHRVGGKTEFVVWKLAPV